MFSSVCFVVFFFFLFIFFLMIRRPPRSTLDRSSAASDVYKRQLYGSANDIGLLRSLGASSWIGFLPAIVALDLGVYAQHRLFHRVVWLWRLHAVHHSDTWFDASTGLRFHLLEALVSLAVKAALVLAIGASPAATLGFEVLLSSASLFSHANTRLPAGLETACLLYTSDAADERSSVDLGGRRIIKKKNKI